MPDTVPVTIEVEPGAAAALADEATRARVGRLVSRMLQPASADRLFEVMDAISAEAGRRGLTDEILEAELAAHNAERRDVPPRSTEEHAAAGRALAAEFREFRRGRSLGGLDPKALIREGLR
jgi:hypothetical protein